MDFYVMTLFPEMVLDGINHSIIKRAMNDNLVKVHGINIRDYSGNKHGKVDDYPYGGGTGLVMTPQPIYNTFLAIKDQLAEDTPVIYLSPKGKPFTQQKAKELSQKQSVVLLCGHYEGVDQRVIDEIVTEELSIGDYVLTGGELGAMVVIDATARLVTGVLTEEATTNESFNNDLLEHPHYTRPFEFMGHKVPEVLVGGHHGKIDQFRQAQSVALTQERRPDLLKTVKEEGDKNNE